MAIFKCTKHTKIIGKNGIYKFKGGVYETTSQEEINELKNHSDVTETTKTKQPDQK